MATSNLNPAVVPPTAAEIATAVAAPSLASITSAVQANAGSPYGGTWTNIYAGNPGAVTTFTTSGLSAYKYIRVGWNDVGCSNAGNNLQIRLNGDSGANYYDVRGYANQTSPYSNTSTMGAVNQFNLRRCDATATLGNTGQFDIYGSNNTSTYKVLNNQQHVFYDGSQQVGLVRAVSVWQATAAISSITFFFANGTFTSTSRLFIDGAN